MPDTLRAVQMRFVYGNSNVSSSLFNIMMWTGLNPPTGETFLLNSQHPQYGDSINEFHTYVIDPPILVSGTIFIGWRQLDNSFLDIGIDKNINSNSKMFFNTSGTFVNSNKPGSWMIRPVFGKEIPNLASTGKEITEDAGLMGTVYPNPAADEIVIQNKSTRGQKIFYKIFRSEEHTSELQSHSDLVCRLLLAKKK